MQVIPARPPLRHFAPAALRRAARIRAMTLANAIAKRSTSASVDAQPRLKRMAPRASSGRTPIAASTCDGATLPDEQAEPELTAIPARSSAIISVAASTPGTAKQTVLGSRGAVSAKITASAATERTAVVRRSRSPISRAGSWSNSARHARAAAPKAGDRRDGFGACSPSALLAAAPHERRAQTDPGARRDKRACAFETAHLVRREHERVGAERGDVARHPPSQLHSVAEHEPVRGMDQRCGFRNRLDHACLVICALQRHERATGTAAGGLEPVEIHASVRQQGRDLGARKPMPRQDAGMLASGDDEPLERRRVRAAAEPGIERGVRRLGAAGDERDATGAHSRQPRDLVPCVFDDTPRGPALGVDRRGIAGRLHRRKRRLARLRAQRRGRVIVEIGSVQGARGGGDHGSDSRVSDENRGWTCGFSLQLPAASVL